MGAWRCCWLIALCLALLGCSGPTDPSDPAATKEAQVFERWLELLSDHEDVEAFGLMRGLPQEWDAKKFGQRVDRLGLRDVGEPEWTSARYLRPKPNPNRNALEEAFVRFISKYPMALEGEVEVGGRSRELWVKVSSDGKLSGLRLGETRFDADGYRIVSRPPVDEPVGPLVERARLDRHRIGEIPFLRVRSTEILPAKASATLIADCQYDAAVYRHAITSSLRESPLSLMARLRGEPSLCQATLRMLRESGRRQARTWCWSPASIRDGPCTRLRPEAPPKTPVAVKRVTARGDDYTLDYDLLMGIHLPPQGDEESASIHLELACGDETHRVSRPLYAKEHPVGIRHTYGALFDAPTASISFPCELAITYQLQSPFKKERTKVFEGCATRDGVSSEPCRR